MVISAENVVYQKIKLIRKYLKLKIIEDNVTFRSNNGQHQERSHVYELIKRSIADGESHSALMIGPRGSGKSTLINSVLSQISREVDVTNDAIIVKLNGLIHHDEKIALKSITAQMKLENAVDDKVFGTFAENLSFLLSCLQSGADRRCRSMVFILEEFDMFCHSGRTQTLLYNLFDITHSKQAPMCVLGVTNRIDVMDMLEKRVKSRFSHRHIFMFPFEDTAAELTGAMPKSPLTCCKEILVSLLSMPLSIARKNVEVSKKKTGRSRKKSVASEVTEEELLPKEVIQRCKINMEQFSELDAEFLSDWNGHISSLVEDERVVDAMEKMCYFTVNEQIFRNILFQLVSQLSAKKPFIDATDLVSIIDKTVTPEHRVKLLQSLSILELSLVIAMKHGMEIFEGQPMNFEMVLHRYTKFANANSSTQSVPRPVILKAFEHLQALEIVMPVKSTDSIYNAGETTASRVQKEYKLYTLAVPVEDINEAVKNFKALPTEISHWYNNSVLINSVLSQISREVDVTNDAIIVKLNGLIHHDEKIALKSITAQMKLENAVDDKVFGTFAENLSFLLSCLQSGADRRCRSMVFILEEFDMFCHSGRTQTLLYNLFDITHSKQAPMCVLGVTNRIDVMDMLEKRVKSRFSHRHIFMFPFEDTAAELTGAIPKSPLACCKEILVSLLSMPLSIARKNVEVSKKKTGRSRKKSVASEVTEEELLPKEVIQRCKINMEQFSELDAEFLSDWNGHISSLVEDERVVDAMEKMCYFTVNEQIFRNILFQLVSQLSAKKPFIVATDLVSIIDKTVTPEHRVKLLQSLSILELSLVIAMKHGMEIFEGQPMNFEMVLHRYTKFANANSSTQSVPRPVILKAFEHLQALEIVMPVKSTDSIYNAGETTASRVQKEYKLYTLAVPVEDINEAVKNFKALPTEISHWYNNSVV